MSDMGQIFKEYNEERKAIRAKNRTTSAEVLTDNGIEFQAHNFGAHLVINADGHVIDFWPGTGLFIPRKSKKRGRGVFNLLKFIEELKKYET